MAQMQHAHTAVGWLGRWLSCSMHTRQWDDWVGGPAATCTHGSGMVGQVAQLQHASMAAGMVGQVAQLQHAHMAAGWLGRWLSCSMHTRQWGGWASGSTAACTHVGGLIGQVAQLQHAHMAVGGLGKWLSCIMHTWQWEGWAGGSAASCTHGSGMVGHVA
jgi:hypothetical protein